MVGRLVGVCSRWVRLNLAREFHIQDVMRMWDAIFAQFDVRLPARRRHVQPPQAQTPSFPLVDFLCVAMVLYVRESRALARDRALYVGSAFWRQFILPAAPAQVSARRGPAGKQPAASATHAKVILEQSLSLQRHGRAVAQSAAPVATAHVASSASAAHALGAGTVAAAS